MKIPSFIAVLGMAAFCRFAAQPAHSQEGQSAAPAVNTVVAPAIPDTSAARDTSAERTQVKFNDAEILGWIQVLDSNEIAAAKAAEGKKIAANVKGYAKMLRDHHKADLKATGKLAKKLKLVPVSNNMADALRAKGAELATALSQLDSAGFAKAYVDAMVQGHADALAVIDTELIPKSVDAATKKHLAGLRKHVETHLKHGKHLQK
jgi:putative membrane protein